MLEYLTIKHEQEPNTPRIVCPIRDLSYDKAEVVDFRGPLCVLSGDPGQHGQHSEHEKEISVTKPVCLPKILALLLVSVRALIGPEPRIKILKHLYKSEVNDFQ